MRMTDEERAPYKSCAEYHQQQAALERSKCPKQKPKRVRRICSNCGHRMRKKSRKMKKQPLPAKAAPMSQQCRTSRPVKVEPRTSQRRRQSHHSGPEDFSATEMFESDSVVSSVSSF